MDGDVTAIFRLAEGAAGTDVADIDWSRPVAPPAGMSRRAYVDAVSQLYHAELATGRLCKTLEKRVPAGPARDFVRAQAGDEMRHARLYGAYLRRLGDIGAMDASLRAALEGGLAWPGSHVAPLVAYSVVLEGEALRLQRACARVFPCATLRLVNAAVARDESRHVAFGRVYLKSALMALPWEERAEIYRWVRGLWTTAAAPPPDGTGTPGGLPARARRRYMEDRWPQHRRVLADIGLLRPGERFPADR